MRPGVRGRGPSGSVTSRSGRERASRRWGSRRPSRERCNNPSGGSRAGPPSGPNGLLDPSFAPVVCSRPPVTRMRRRERTPPASRTRPAPAAASTAWPGRAPRRGSLGERASAPVGSRGREDRGRGRGPHRPREGARVRIVPSREVRRNRSYGGRALGRVPFVTDSAADGPQRGQAGGQSLLETISPDEGHDEGQGEGQDHRTGNLGSSRQPAAGKRPVRSRTFDDRAAGDPSCPREHGAKKDKPRRGSRCGQGDEGRR